MKYKISKALCYKLASAGLGIQFLGSNEGCSGKNSNESTTGDKNDINHKHKADEHQRFQEQEQRNHEEREERLRREEEERRRREEEDRIKEENRLKEEKKQFNKDHPLSKEGKEIVEKIKSLPDGKDEQIKVSGFEKDIKDKGILKIIAKLDKDKINECISNKDKWSKIYKNVSAEIFAEFIEIEYSDKQFVLTFDEKTLLPNLNKELFKDLLTIFKNDSSNYSYDGGDSYGRYNNFAPEVISYIAKKSKEEQKEFLKNYYYSRILEEAGFDKMTQKIDMKAIKLFEEIVEEINSDSTMLKNGLQFWYLLVSNEIKIEESFFKIMLSAVDSEISFWKRAKYFLKNDKFKTFDKDKVKVLLDASKFCYLENDEQYKNMVDYLISSIELTNGIEVIKNLNLNFLYLGKFSPHLLSNSELIKKINSKTDVMQFYNAMGTAFYHSSNNKSKLKKSDFREIEKIVDTFVNGSTYDYTQLKIDVENYIQNNV